ncbi:MAG: ATP-binding domain-containing protein, partial [Nitriliruptoraceae bacterium]
VLGDICGPHGSRPVLQLSAPALAALDPLVGGALAAEVEPAARPGIGDVVVRLSRFRRFDAEGGIARVAAAIQRGESEVAELHPSGASAQVRRVDPVTDPGARRRVVAMATDAYAQVVRTAREGHPPAEVLAELERIRVLCAHRRGPDGVDRWNAAIAAALAARSDGDGSDRRFPVGRPLLVTENDRALRLANGDVGVVVPDPGAPERTVVAFAADGGGVRLLSPARLPVHEPTYAMTIHKSQGSQFQHAVVVLGERSSPLLTRELVYTAITRAIGQVTVLAGDAALDQALARPVQRASGLGARLWQDTRTLDGPQGPAQDAALRT